MYKKYKPYICFSGADVVAFIDNKAYGEVLDININTKSKELIIKTVLFDTLIKTHKEFQSMTNSKILVVFLNEYGNKMYRVYDGIKFSHEEIEYSIEKIKMNNSYIFSYRNSSDYEDFSTSIEKLREDVFNV